MNYHGEIIPILMIVSVSFSVILLFLLVLLIYRLRMERNETIQKISKINKIYEGLYKEYEVVCGADWAKRRLSELVRNIVKDKPTRRFNRV